MKPKANDQIVETIDTRQDADTVDEAQDALVDSDLFDAIYGEPTDEEIARALRQAEADFHAGKYLPTQEAPDTSKEDDEPWRPRTKKEILEGIALGYMQALAGDVLTFDEFLDQLKE